MSQRNVTESKRHLWVTLTFPANTGMSALVREADVTVVTHRGTTVLLKAQQMVFLVVLLTFFFKKCTLNV